MHRRLRLAAFACALAFVATAAIAQTYRIGVLSAGTRDDGISPSFLDQLRKLGYEEGKNLVLETRYADWNPAKFGELAQDLVRLKPHVIFAPTNSGARAARDATRAIPIIFAIVPDPVGEGLVATLARPGSNVTGTSNVQTGLTPKRIQLLQEVIPSLARLAIIYDGGDKVAVDQLNEARKTAAELRLHLSAYDAQKLPALQKAFESASKDRVQAVLIAGSLTTYHMAKPIAELATKHRLPTVSPDRRYVEEGALISYGVDIGALYAKAATYVHRVLNGARPADLPVQEADKFEMLVNMRTANVLGVTIPQSVALRADRTIQ
jgi:putative ABC transport system substrate-binding protein